jgi:hypothetical protein
VLLWRDYWICPQRRTSLVKGCTDQFLNVLFIEGLRILHGMPRRKVFACLSMTQANWAQVATSGGIYVDFGSDRHWINAVSRKSPIAYTKDRSVNVLKSSIFRESNSRAINKLNCSR